MLFWKQEKEIILNSPEEFMRSSQELIDSYLKPSVETDSSISNVLELNMQQNKNALHHTQDMVTQLEENKAGLSTLLIISAFPRFLKSQIYLDYIQSKL